MSSQSKPLSPVTGKTTPASSGVAKVARVANSNQATTAPRVHPNSYVFNFQVQTCERAAYLAASLATNSQIVLSASTGAPIPTDRVVRVTPDVKNSKETRTALGACARNLNATGFNNNHVQQKPPKKASEALAAALKSLDLKPASSVALQKLRLKGDETTTIKQAKQKAHLLGCVRTLTKHRSHCFFCAASPLVKGVLEGCEAFKKTSAIVEAVRTTYDLPKSATTEKAEKAARVDKQQPSTSRSPRKPRQRAPAAATAASVSRPQAKQLFATLPPNALHNSDLSELKPPVQSGSYEEYLANYAIYVRTRSQLENKIAAEREQRMASKPKPPPAPVAPSPKPPTEKRKARSKRRALKRKENRARRAAAANKAACAEIRSEIQLRKLEAKRPEKKDLVPAQPEADASQPSQPAPTAAPSDAAVVDAPATSLAGAATSTKKSRKKARKTPAAGPATGGGDS